MIPVSKSIERPAGLFNLNQRGLKVCLVVMFLLAALIRRDEIKAPGHLIVREYNSAIVARAFYLNGNDLVEPWQKKIAMAVKDQLPILEPPVTEYLVSVIYRFVGREELWYSRYLTGFFWLMGGIFLYEIARRLISVDGALVALGYYLFAPWGIIISRSFQPDSLMMMMFLISLYGMVLHFEKPSWQRLLLTGGITGTTLLLRPLVLFTLVCVFLALWIHQKGKWTLLFDKRVAVFLFLAFVFPLVFYGYGIFIDGYLEGQADLSFRPYLLIRPEFWIGWFDNSTEVIGKSLLILSFAGFLLLRTNLTRSLATGWVVGYFVFGLVFTYHIHSHRYYQIQLLPLVGLCIAPVVVTIGSEIKKLMGGTGWLPLLAALLVALSFSYRDVRSTLYTKTFEDPGLAAEIGEVVDHSPRVVFIADHYGMPLVYYGQISGVSWPVRIDDSFYRHPDARELTVQERLDGLGFVPEYFVITNFDLYNRKHQDLEAYLKNNCSAIKETEAYLIYANCGRESAK